MERRDRFEIFLVYKRFVDGLDLGKWGILRVEEIGDSREY